MPTSLGLGLGLTHSKGGGAVPYAPLNRIRNPSGAGAAAGSPGTLPTNWQKNSTTLSTDVAGTGTEGGIPYVDFRIHGTATGSDAVGIYFETAPGAAAAFRQKLTQSVYLKVAAGSSPIGTKATLQMSFDEFDSGNGYLTTDSGADQEASGPTGAALNTQPFTQSFTMTNADTYFVVPSVFMFFYGSGAIDFTLRIGGPKLVANMLNIATRANAPWLFSSANKQAMSRRGHFARDTITALQLVLPNWYVDTTNNGSTYTELGGGSTMTCTASIEYPAGTFTQITFGGSASGTAATLKNLVSDLVAIAIPKDAQFWTRVFYTSTTGVIYSADGTALMGDTCAFAASGLSDQTMSGTISGTAGFSYPPLSINAVTTKQSAALVGTSRTEGAQDTNDSSGDLGVSARSIGPVCGYIQMGIPGDSMVKFIASHQRRLAAARAWCSDIFVEHAVNDNASNEATKEANLATIWGYFPTQQVHALTVDPNTTGAWSAADGSDQTVAQDFTTLNGVIRAKPAPLFAVCDVAAVTCIPGTPTKWQAGYTGDGLHENQTGNLAIKASGRVRLAA